LPATAIVLGLMSIGALLAPHAAAAATADSPQARMVAAINEARDDYGLAPLKRVPALERSAGAVAEEMMESGLFAHGPSIEAPRRFEMLGEALSKHRGTRPAIDRTVEGWVRSPIHRPILFGSGFTGAGANLVRGRFGGDRSTIWVLQLGG
jgi:uncharacterized protein YkwD